MKVAVDMLGFC